MNNYNKQYIKDLAYAYLFFAMIIMILVSALCVIMPSEQQTSVEYGSIISYESEQTW